jgi:uncharacterized membrane protein (Fun14 family)
MWWQQPAVGIGAVVGLVIGYAVTAWIKSIFRKK